jgi:hypothetical protein
MALTESSLDTLPDELILAILSHINQLPALASLSLTNHRLHRLSLPSLYHTFPGRNSELFLRTISHHPDIASHVKSASWNQDRKATPRLDVLEKQHIINRLNELCVPHGTDLSAQFAEFGKNDDYWYFEILLLFMPRIEEVEIKASWLWDDHHYWFKSLSLYFNPLRDFAGLKKAYIEGPMRIENAVPLLTIATLRELELTQVTVMRREGYRVFQWSVWPVSKVLPERSSHLEVLALRESYIDLNLLQPVLRGIKALKSFTYEHVPNDLADLADLVDLAGGARLPENEFLASCLKLHAHSLEHIRFRDMRPLFWINFMDLLFGPLKVTKDAYAQSFPNLKMLDVGPIEDSLSLTVDVVQALTRSRVGTADRLPASLETLKLKIASYVHFDTSFTVLDRWIQVQENSENDHRVEALLKDLACALADANHPLKVEIVEWNPTLGWFPDDLPIIEKMYAELGLEIVSIAGDVGDFYNAEPLLMDDESEEGWVVVTDLDLPTRYHL